MAIDEKDGSLKAADAERPASVPLKGRWTALILATLGFTINFWAWSIISPLGKTFGDSLGLSSFQIGLLVAVPVIVGSLGRIPIGALTDRFGGRVMFVALSIVVILPVVFLAFFQSYASLLIGGFFLGLAGTSFAIGIAFVTQWFPPEQRGMALGIYGAGNIGTAISGRLTPKMFDAGHAVPFLIVIIPLVLIALAFLFIGRESPTRTRPEVPFGARMGAAARMPIAWDLAVLYAITFGGFVAWGTYLPTYLSNVYGLDKIPAGAKLFLFVVVATLARPVGGWLSDRISADKVLTVVLTVAAAGALVLGTQQTFTDGVPALAEAALLGVAVCLGVGNGAVFALVGKRVSPSQSGSVTGLVGAAGGIGGFFPPLFMGWVYGRYSDYWAGLIALALVAAFGAVYTVKRVSAHGSKHEGGSPTG